MARCAAASPATGAASPTAAQDPSQAAREAMATPGFRNDPTVAELASSTPHAYQKPDPRWDALQESMHATAAALAPGLVSLKWPEASVEQAVAALDRDGAFVLEAGMPPEACDLLKEQMDPYVEASYTTADGSNASRPGAVLGRSRASWPFATHPFLRQICEG